LPGLFVVPLFSYHVIKTLSALFFFRPAANPIHQKKFMQCAVKYYYSFAFKLVVIFDDIVDHGLISERPEIAVHFPKRNVLY